MPRDLGHSGTLGSNGLVIGAKFACHVSDFATRLVPTAPALEHTLSLSLSLSLSLGRARFLSEPHKASTLAIILSSWRTRG